MTTAPVFTSRSVTKKLHQLTFALIASLMLSLPSNLLQAATKPNILFFLVDDLGYQDVSLHGSALYETPALDSFAGDATELVQAYAAHPRCVPSRYAMLTGRYPARAQIPARVEQMALEEVTLAEALKEAGYTTFFAGKWHLGHTPELWPEQQGFDVNIAGCQAGAPAHYFTPYKRPGDHWYTTIQNLSGGETGEYLTDRLTDETISFIKENQNHPFLVYLAHYAVHTPLEAKSELTKHFKSKIEKINYTQKPYAHGPDGRVKQRHDNATYAAMVASMDESFGRIIQTLKEEELYDNTIIIVTSDHGGLSNSGSESRRPLATSNLPYRAGKGHCYEGGIKVPSFIRWPGHTQAGSKLSLPVTGTDYYPTLLEMAGIAAKPEQHLDGITLAPFLKDPDTPQPERSLFWHSPKSRPHNTGDQDCSVIRKGDFKLLQFYNDNRIELYNLAQDPFEEDNLVDSQPERANALLQALIAWKEDIHAAELPKDRPQK